MKAILLNDTAPALHTGCSLVMQNTLVLCKDSGIRIVDRIPFNKTEAIGPSLAKHADASLVLINGEGTMHHDRPAAMALGQSAEEAKRQGKLVVLYNTVWDENHHLNKYLPSFDLIFCRESISRQAINRAGFQATTVPDMIFATERPMPCPKSSREGVVVIDSVSGTLSKKLTLFSIRHGYHFLPLSQSAYDRISRKWLLHHLLAWRSKSPPLKWSDNLPKMLSQYEFAISGRFHGSCLCFLAGTPVASIGSNTHKTQGLYKDIGLDPELINTANRPLTMPTLQTQVQHQRQWRTMIEDYVNQAPLYIKAMFKQICDLGSSVS